MAKNTISAQNHMQVFAALIKAGEQGMHGKPGDKKSRGK